MAYPPELGLKAALVPINTSTRTYAEIARLNKVYFLNNEALSLRAKFYDVGVLKV